MIGMMVKNVVMVTNTTNGVGMTGKTKRTSAARCTTTRIITRSAATTTSIESGITTTKTVSRSFHFYSSGQCSSGTRGIVDHRQKCDNKKYDWDDNEKCC